jgi:molybdenum cofactor cytidylyltransferase
MSSEDPLLLIHIGAVVVAAGMSQRMGQPKLILPWGSTTIIGQVVHTLSNSGITEIVVVTGGARQKVEEAVKTYPVKTVFNPEFSSGDMAVSLKIGLNSLTEPIGAALVVLGDQPQLKTEVIQAIIQQFNHTHGMLIVPSYQMHRGHPWLINRGLWPDLLALSSSYTLRDFLQSHAKEIEYLDVETPTVLMDLDTPDDYQKQKPEKNNRD